MTTISEIFRTFGTEYISQFADGMPRHHLKVVNAIISCRTSSCGIVIYDCQRCGHSHVMFRSCGNRHCPVCQNHKTRQWLDKRMKRQLPAHHFLITFTVPENLRRFIRSHQRQAYSALFKASSNTLKVMASNDRFARGDLPGFFGVLHTWGRQLHYHPHIHYIVPGGALSKSDGTWHPTPSRSPSLTAVSSKSITERSCSGTKNLKVTGGALWPWMSWSSSAGFCSISFPLAKVAALIELSYGREIDVPEGSAETSQRPCCPNCGGPLVIKRWIHPLMVAFFDYG